MSCICKIEKAANGYEVELHDPAIAKANEKSKGSWRDPMVSHVFTSTEDVLKFLKANLDKAGPNEEYESAFATMSSKDED